MSKLHIQYCHILQGVLQKRGSLGSLLDLRAKQQAGASAGLLQQWCYGVCRWYHRLDAMAAQLIERPLRNKDQDLHCLILLGLYQLYFMRTPDHAVLNETVAAADDLHKAWARNLINAVLREALRTQDDLLAHCQKDYSHWYSHPSWLLDRIKRDWPSCYRDILDANNQPGPMTLRVNRLQQSREAYLGLLRQAGIEAQADTLSDYAIQLSQPVDVFALPGFRAGWVSVQDAASQLVASVLPVAAGMRVLDICAAPGGKSCALLEAQPQLQLSALDADASRLVRVHDNLERLGLHATVRHCDLTATPDEAPDSADAILLDVPCSGTGVIRRHPDIKLLRTPAELSTLTEKQQALLQAAWPLLKPGGYLLYSTCSILREENDAQIVRFSGTVSGVQALPPPIPGAEVSSLGAQLLPRINGHDGFYYALLRKH